MSVDKKNLTEEDIKLRYITPAITTRWKLEQISMEAVAKAPNQITDGQIELRGNLISRKRPGRVDYLLSVYPNYPIAVVEAKDNKHAVSDGLGQAMDYAQRLDVKFAYSSNGDAFREHDFFTGKERDFPLSDFPSPNELLTRYEAGIHNGAGLNQREKSIIQTPYYTSQNTPEPRYYQRVAVNRTLDAIARGQNRVLLVMATGTGKTYTAFQIVYRLLQSDLKHKILYLADRNNLVDQSIEQDFAPLENIIHKVNFSKDDPKTVGAYEVYFSLYQQLAGETETDDDTEDENAVEKFQALFRPDFFDLVIVDECHRGSAKKDSNWRRILEYFSSATQIGMTATPRETKYISNADYFGQPVYTYSLRKGIEDGFLAPFKVIHPYTNIGDGWRPAAGQRDIYGNEIEDRIYNNSDYDYNIILKDRIRAVAEEITKYLHSVGRMDKTIVFCANERHALMMRDALADLNADMMKEYPDYVVRITGSDIIGKKKLEYFISVTSPTPVIATTSELLSTGVDCKMVKLIVLDQMIGSMTKFKQIIGRGTRLRWDDGKTHFVVMDFRNVTRLFSDPDWDGPIQQDEDYDPNGTVNPGSVNPPPGPVIPTEKPVVDANGCPVFVWGKTVSVYDPSGKLLRQENIIDYTKSNILGEYASLENFIRKWSDEEKKETIRALFRERGIDLDAMKAEQNMNGIDDFDFICHVAFDQKPLTRRERAENVKKRDFFSKYSGAAREVLETLLDRYMNAGIYEIEKTEVLKLDDFKRFGKPGKIAKLFGGPAGYQKAIRELEREIYKAG